MSDRSEIEDWSSLYFLIAIGALVLFWFLASSHPVSVRVAAIGGFISALGGILMALPVLRIGPYQWIANLHAIEIVVADRPGTPRTQPEKKETRESESKRKSDLLMQHIFGPYLIGVGTITNGISGFF